MFSLEEVECIGACSWAPAIQVNYDFHQNVTPEKLDQIHRRASKKAALSRRCRSQLDTTNPVRIREVTVLTASASACKDSRQASTSTSSTDGYKAFQKALAMTPDAIIDEVKTSEPARPRRRGLPDRHEVELRAQAVAQAEVHRCATPTRASPAPAKTAC